VGFFIEALLSFLTYTYGFTVQDESIAVPELFHFGIRIF